MQMKADTIRHLKESEEMESMIESEENNSTVDSKLSNGSAFGSSTNESTKRTNDTNLSDCDKIISDLIRTSSNAQPSSSVGSIPKPSCCSENPSSQTIINNMKSSSIASNLTNSITSNLSADYRRNRGVLDLNNLKANDSNDTHQTTSFRSDTSVSYL